MNADTTQAGVSERCSHLYNSRFFGVLRDYIEGIKMNNETPGQTEQIAELEKRIKKLEESIAKLTAVPTIGRRMIPDGRGGSIVSIPGGNNGGY